MNTEPKPQTPLTDAIYMRCRDLVGCDTHTDYDIFVEMTEHARSLELKLQEAALLIRGLETTQTFLENENKEFERQRDEAKHLMECANTPVMKDVLTERDQLIEVVDELADALKAGLGTHGDPCSAGGSCSVVINGEKALEAYYLLPHRQVMKQTL